MDTNKLSNSACELALAVAGARKAARTYSTGVTKTDFLRRFRARLRPHLKPVSLARGEVLRDIDEPLTRLCFVRTVP